MSEKFTHHFCEFEVKMTQHFSVFEVRMTLTGLAELLGGFVKLKKIKKSEKNSDWPDPTYPPLYPFFFLETCTTTKTTQNFRKKI